MKNKKLIDHNIDLSNEIFENKRFILKLFLHFRGVMEDKEFRLMADMLKIAIKQERELTSDEVYGLMTCFKKIAILK